ncbi:MAG: OmcA/MtrC family decaheme c-type cytochrome [Bryobacteraceae bacterium]|jgi:OmcA/MtrC family decaheme c-type cytochrome
MRITGTAIRILAGLVALTGTLALTGTHNSLYSKRDKAFYADQAVIDFVRPGLVITINSASINSSGVISVTYTLTDPAGLPLDSAGVTTPGAVSLAYVAAYIPQGQEQYVAYTTASATGKALGTIIRPDFELGGTATATGTPGQYQYTFIAKAPAGFDPTVTTTVAVDGNRNLTAFGLQTYYAGTTFNFVPNGSPVTVTRDVVRTASCNTCHDTLVFHGGYAHGTNMCVLCHQPQNVDPTTGNTLDLKVMAHKIHMGSSLPSVVAGTPYEIAGYMGFLSNFSTVIDPASAQRCEVCHSQTTGAAQEKAFLTEPSRAACGACHDDVNFATGANHPGGIQNDDKECADCHIPQGEMPFDASILGAHVVNTDTPATYPQNPDTLLAGINLAISGVTNNSAGETPTVTFTLQDDSGNNIPLSQATTLEFTMAGPTTDYGYTSFGSDVTTPGYVTESAAKATCSAGGVCTYTFTHAIPATATGTYTMGGEARMNVSVPVLTGGTTTTQVVNLGAMNPLINFSVDGSPVTPRRTVVALSNCNNCHVALSLHGNLRNQTEYCVLCHNPSNTDASQRVNAVVASDKALPPQGINFNLLVHRIHDGVNVVANGGKPYIVVGYGGSHNDFSGVLFPAFSPSGSATDLADCALCHVNSSEQNDLTISGLNPVTDPQGLINPVQPFTSACTGCHVGIPTASHALSNTTSLGEACAVCHGSGAAFAVDQEHAGF